MRKIYEVSYQLGPSRFNPPHSADWMLARVGDVELYAEMAPYPDDEVDTYEELKAAIIEQAKEAGIDPRSLRFWFDEEVDPDEKERKNKMKVKINTTDHPLYQGVAYDALDRDGEVLGHTRWYSSYKEASEKASKLARRHTTDCRARHRINTLDPGCAWIDGLNAELDDDGTVLGAGERQGYAWLTPHCWDGEKYVWVNCSGLVKPAKLAAGLRQGNYSWR